MRPNFRPFRIHVAIESFPKLVGRGLIVILEEKYLADAVMCERAVAIHLERLLEFLQGPAKVAHFDELLAAFNRDGHAGSRSPAQDIGAGIDSYRFRLAKSVHGEFRGCTNYIDALSLRIAFGLDLQIHGHVERVQILRDLAHHAEAFLGAE